MVRRGVREMEVLATPAHRAGQGPGRGRMARSRAGTPRAVREDRGGESALWVRNLGRRKEKQRFLGPEEEETKSEGVS